MSKKHVAKEGFFGDPAWGLTKRLAHSGYEETIARVRTALAAEGFGVLTEIDVSATLRKKLDVDFPRYVILGACHPPSAHRALSTEPGVGLLLPCNVVVAEEEGGGAVVSALDPRAVFSLLRQPALEDLAENIGASMDRMLASLD